MPPRGAGQPRGRGGPRGGGPPRGRGGATQAPTITAGLPPSNAHVTTIGVKRTGYGRAGRPIKVSTNHFPVTTPQSIIHHYDVVISPSENKLPARLNMLIITTLQTVVAPAIFTPPAVYDGRKNMFSPFKLKFAGDKDHQEFDVTLSDPTRPAGAPAGRQPKPYKVKLTHVAEINPEVLARFLEGKQSHDNTVLTALTALNVVIRMEPMSRYPFNVRSFFTPQETKEIGGGLVLWRGYFQSVRPAVGRMLINIDISTGTMYKPGALIGLCLDYAVMVMGPNAANVRTLIPRAKGGNLDERLRGNLSRFISGVRIQTIDATGKPFGVPRVLRRLSNVGASDLSFTLREGGTKTVAQYFQEQRNRPLQNPHMLCAEVGSGALIPLELCHVPPGQIMRKQVPPEKTKDVLDFATKRPAERLESIKRGLGVLAYGQSPYVRQFGLVVEEQTTLKIGARVLDPPTLRYGDGSKQKTVQPRGGAWNMIEKKFYKPMVIHDWFVIVYERSQRFREEAVRETIDGFLDACKDVGIVVQNTQPHYGYANPQGKIYDDMRTFREAALAKQKGATKINPNLIVAILPEGSLDIYTAIKHFGDCIAGVATQCMKSTKCFRAKKQYFANVLLKVNVKLGGINTIPDAQSVSILTDPANPTIVMGADVIHPAPGSDGRPSFTAVVGNVDKDTAKYIATSRVQTSRQEMIDDLESMAKNLLENYMGYRRNVEKVASAAPKRIIFYRDGVSEGQFKQVLEIELPRLQAACKSLNINPKITVIVVGKRHHVRFFPEQKDEDRSGNCPAGTVVDSEISHPTEFDYYLLSHGGLLGTSRPSHYSILHDENAFSPDALQSLSFALCHVYARATRSVSIPAPVYYADIVCSRARNHYDPTQQQGFNFSESGGGSQDDGAEGTLEAFRRNFKPVHATTSKLMYFS